MKKGPEGGSGEGSPSAEEQELQAYVDRLIDVRVAFLQEYIGKVYAPADLAAFLKEDYDPQMLQFPNLLPSALYSMNLDVEPDEVDDFPKLAEAADELFFLEEPYANRETDKLFVGSAGSLHPDLTLKNILSEIRSRLLLRQVFQRGGARELFHKQFMREITLLCDQLHKPLPDPWRSAVNKYGAVFHEGAIESEALVDEKVEEKINEITFFPTNALRREHFVNISKEMDRMATEVLDIEEFADRILGDRAGMLLPYEERAS